MQSNENTYRLLADAVVVSLIDALAICVGTQSIVTRCAWRCEISRPFNANFPAQHPRVQPGGFRHSAHEACMGADVPADLDDALYASSVYGGRDVESAK
jgi:hypothetical protein